MRGGITEKASQPLFIPIRDDCLRPRSDNYKGIVCRSRLGQIIAAFLPAEKIIIGDAEYQLLNFCMIPYENWDSMPQKEKNYNYCH